MVISLPITTEVFLRQREESFCRGIAVIKERISAPFKHFDSEVFRQFGDSVHFDFPSSVELIAGNHCETAGTDKQSFAVAK